MPKGKQNNWLYSQYLFLNEKYFDNKLPKKLIISESSKLICKAGVSYFHCFPNGLIRPIEICLSQKYIQHYPNELNIILLHEMVHIKLKVMIHNNLFLGEIKRLKNLFGIEIPLIGNVNKYYYKCLGCGKIYCLDESVNIIINVCNECYNYLEELEVSMYD